MQAPVSMTVLLQQKANRFFMSWLLLLLCSIPTVLMKVPVDSSCRQGDCVHSLEKRSNVQCLVPDSNPLIIGESVFHTTEIMRGTEAVDLCLIVSTTSSMSNQLWLQIAVPVLDAHLLTLGIGTGEEIKNRYCLVIFGGNSQTRFIQVNGEIFFPFHIFYQARRQLEQNGGTVSDGYEAINFTVNNAPFREHPNVVKFIVLVTDSDRTPSPLHSDISRTSILQLLYTKHFVMDTVVSISLQLADTTNEGTVLGFHGYQEASILRPDGGYEMSHNQTIHFTQAAGETIQDYVALSLALNSSSWPLSLVGTGNYSTILSFANAFTNVHGLFPTLPVEVCEQCECMEAGRISCGQPVDQEQCHCLITGTSEECGVVMPTPTSTYVTSYLAPTATPDPVVIEIDGHVTTQRGGDTIIYFTSNHDQLTYQCILMPDGIESPVINTCSSPYQLSTPTPGRYSLLVLAHHQGHTQSLLLWFEVLPLSGRLQVTAIQRSITSNASILVEFASNRLDVQFQCSTGDGPFQRCTSPHLIPPIAPGVREEVFIVLATDTNGNAAASVLKIEDPTILPPTTETQPGPVMIEVWAKLPDPDGVLRICFRPTRNDVTCICTVDADTDNVQGPIICFNRTSGRGDYAASPDELGTGPHTLDITCMDDDAYASSESIKFNLAEPPLVPPPTEALHCNLSLVGPDDRGILLATHDCTRPVTSFCQVSRLQATSCGREYSFNTSPLGPGNHVFVLVAEDGFGDSIMKVFPFFIETAQRKCCPEIVSNLSNITIESDMLVHIHLAVTPGNCSLNEGFSYGIDWGDAASESGTKTHLSNLYSSRQYSVPGEYSINAVYCNNPAASEDTCCSSLVLSVNLNSSQQT